MKTRFKGHRSSYAAEKEWYSRLVKPEEVEERIKESFKLQRTIYPDNWLYCQNCKTIICRYYDDDHADLSAGLPKIVCSKCDDIPQGWTGVLED